MKRSMIILLVLAFVTGSVLAFPTASTYGDAMNTGGSDLSISEDDDKGVCYLCSSMFTGADCTTCQETGPEYIRDPETGYVYANTFGNGTVIPEDFVDPVHGAGSVSDPRNIVLYRPWPTRTLPPLQPHDDAMIRARLDYYNFPLPTWTGSTRVLGRLSQFI